MKRPVALDLCSGLGGWAEGLEAEGWDVIRVDITDMFAQTGTPKPKDCLLMVQDIRTFHGSQAKGCGLIVASPPCTEFSWMAMPWSRAKHVARALRGEGEFPANYRGSRTIEQLTSLFDACFRIQAQASLAAGRHIPMVVENVRGAQPWVGRCRWSFGSFCLWGDVPALMPQTFKAQNFNPDGTAHPPGSWFAIADSRERGAKSSGMNWSDQTKRGQDFTRLAGRQAMEGIKAANVEGYERNHPNAFGWAKPRTSSKSPARKAASAMIAKIPEALSRHIAAVYRP